MVHKRFAQAAAAMVPFVLAFVVACPSQPETESFRMLPARFADEQFTEPLEALEMLRDEDEFYLRYRMGDEILFAGDSGNDLDVLAGPVPAVLVANANDAVRQVAEAQSSAAGTSASLYLAGGGLLGMNGNYAGGMLEGIAHYFPASVAWMGFDSEAPAK